MPRRTSTQQRRKLVRRGRLRRRARGEVVDVVTTSHMSSKRRQRGEPSAVRCTSGKTGWSKAVAERKLEEFQVAPGRRRSVPVRVYRCHLGDHWHVTSRPEPPRVS